MTELFQPSSVDWCEPNYQYMSSVAEIFNTITSTCFILSPPLFAFLFREYSRVVNPAINVIWIMFTVVGLCGGYQHATLNLIGQLLEEMSSFWLVMVTFIIFLPRRAIPSFFIDNRMQFGWTIGSAGVIVSAFSVEYPILITAALFMMGFVMAAQLVAELGRAKCKRVRRLGIQFALMLLLSVVCWFFDRIFCKTWTAISFPYLHGLWHIFIFFAFYMGCVLLAYFSVVDECIGNKEVLKYWPCDCEPGIPYVTLIW